MNQFEALQALIALDERGSLTASAAYLNTPKSTLSRRIAKLEELLGARLTFEEKGRLSLSKAGHCYLVYARKILHLAHESQAALQRFTQEVSGEIHVQLGAEVNNGWIVKVLHGFVKRYPQVRLCVNRATGLAAAAGRDDVILACGTRQVLQGFRCIELCAWERRLYIARQSSIPIAQCTDVAQIQQLPWIGQVDDLETVHLIHRYTGERYSFEHRARLQVESLSMLAEALAQGCGVGSLPRWVAECEQYGRTYELQAYLPEWSAAPLVFAAYVPQHDTSYSIRMLVAFLQQHLPERWVTQGAGVA